MSGIVSPEGRVVLTPEVKAWMRAYRPLNPENTIVYNWSHRLGEQAERNNPRVCGHCVTNHLIDVFDRYVRIFGRGS